MKQCFPFVCDYWQAVFLDNDRSASLDMLPNQPWMGDVLLQAILPIVQKGTLGEFLITRDTVRNDHPEILAHAAPFAARADLWTSMVSARPAAS